MVQHTGMAFILWKVHHTTLVTVNTDIGKVTAVFIMKMINSCTKGIGKRVNLKGKANSISKMIMFMMGNLKMTELMGRALDIGEMDL